jgi:multidrug efflux pump subunit AcrA (membrane-fusion protein)
MTVSRCAADLSTRHGPTAVCVCPLRRAGGACAAIVVERPISDPFTQEEADALRLTCDLVAPRLLDLDEHGRWIGVRLTREARRALSALVGPRHTWAKAGVALGFALVVFLSFARGTDWVVAPFTLEAVERRIVAAPFDALVAASAVDVGESVVAGETVLAELDTTEHRLRLAAARAERSEHLTKAAAARNESRTADARIAQAEADRAQAEIDLLESRIAQARIVAPISGRIIAGGLRRAVGAPVRAGDLLFEVAPLDTLRVEIRAPEGRAADIQPGQRGVLAGASRPGDRTPFLVESVDPVAEARDGLNAFTVRATVGEPAGWMRPGMSGVAKIDAGSRRLISIWSRPLVDWLRLRLWI